MSTTKTEEAVKTAEPHALEQRNAASTRAKRALYLIVFVAGAVMMGVEIAGAKVLAPGFGTSIFVWGSLIGLFMGAMAAGYFVGGMLADRRPSFTTLATIVSLAGLWTALVIPRFGKDIADWVARQDGLGNIFGPLVASLIIFFLPSFLMAMVSPYAVKLQASSLSGIGSVAGRLTALSTLGSIVGTLATTFVLIPFLFLGNVMQGLGLLLMLTAIISLLMFLGASGPLNRIDRTGMGVMVLVALICAVLWAGVPVRPHVPSGARLIEYVDSPYHEVLVVEEVSYTRDREQDYVLLPQRSWKHGKNDLRRWLKFNENTESGIYPYAPEYKNAVAYTDLLHLPMIWLQQPPQKILVVGGGGGVIPTQYASFYGSQVDVAEIDPVVARVAVDWFQVPNAKVYGDIRTYEAAPQKAQISFIVGDGRQIVKRLPGPYDLIVLDAYSSGGQIPFHLLTWEFLSLVKSKLSARGILATNIISALRNDDPNISPRPADLFLAEYRTLQASRAEALQLKSDRPEDNQPLFKRSQLYVFPKMFEDRRGPGYYDTYRNVIVLATPDSVRKSRDDLKEALAPLIAGRTPLIRGIENMPFHVDQIHEPREDELKDVPPLCDDFAPVDFMYRPVRREETTMRLAY